MKYANLFPVVCLVSSIIFVLSLFVIVTVLRTAPPENNLLFRVPLAFVIGIVITAPALLIAVASGAALVMRHFQKREEKAATQGTPKRTPPSGAAPDVSEKMP
jgi:hypothetical protein